MQTVAAVIAAAAAVVSQRTVSPCPQWRPTLLGGKSAVEDESTAEGEELLLEEVLALARFESWRPRQCPESGLLRFPYAHTLGTALGGD